MSVSVSVLNYHKMNRFLDGVKGIIFDYGGTIDTGGDHWSEVIWKAYQEESVPVSKDQFRDAYVFAERELAKTRHILPHHDFRDLMRIKMRIEFDWLVEQGILSSDMADAVCVPVAERCYDAARRSVERAKPVIETLARQYPLVLVSNFYGNVEAVLTDFDLRKYFQTIVESAVVGVRKPDPKIFALGVEALGMKPEEVLVVGDSLRKDILPAESIGCRVAWIKGKGWTPEEDAQTHPGIIPSLRALLPD